MGPNVASARREAHGAAGVAGAANACRAGRGAVRAVPGIRADRREVRAGQRRGAARGGHARSGHMGGGAAPDGDDGDDVACEPPGLGLRPRFGSVGAQAMPICRNRGQRGVRSDASGGKSALPLRPAPLPHDHPAFPFTGARDVSRGCRGSRGHRAQQRRAVEDHGSSRSATARRMAAMIAPGASRQQTV